MSTSVHGVQALIVKPSQSIAPIFGVWILACTDAKAPVDGAVSGSQEHSSELQSAIYYLYFGMPLLCTLIQIYVWYKFDLKGDKLAQIKRQLKGDDSVKI